MHRFFRPLPLTLAALLGIVGYALIGFFLLPYLIATYGIPKASELIRHPIVVKEVAVNPFELSLTLTGLEVRAQDQSAMVGFEEFFVNLQGAALFRGAYAFDAIRLHMPYAAVHVDASGHLNLLDLIPPAPMEPVPSEPPPPAKAGLPEVEIGLFEMTQGIIEFRDESKPTPVSIDMVPLNITLRNFHTKPGGDNIYAFTAELGKDEVLDWKGTIALEPLRSDGLIEIRGVKMATLFQYVQDQFRVAIPAGMLEAKATYHVDMSEEAGGFRMADASLAVHDMVLVEKGTVEPVVEIGTLALDGIEVDVPKRTVAVAGLRIDRSTTRIWRNPDQTLNVAQLFAPVPPAVPAKPGPPSSPDSAEAGPAWTVALKEFADRQHRIVFEDRSLSRPMNSTVMITALQTYDVAWPLKGPVPLTLDQVINDTGTLHVEGQVTLAPFQAELTMNLHQLALAPFEPYLDQTTNIGLQDGALDVAGRLHLATEHLKTPLMTFAGTVSVASLAVVNRVDDQPVIGWKQVALRNMTATVDPLSVALDEVVIDQPRLVLQRLEDETLNVSHLVKESTPPPASTDEAPSPAPPPPIAVKTVRMTKAEVVFQDEAIHPTVRTRLHDVSGTIKGLSSKQVAKADVDLTGRLDNTAPLTIAGKINPLSEEAYTDLTVKWEHIDLTTASPYSGKYAGYPIRKGKLSLDLVYKLSQSELMAENTVLIDQLGFGEKTDSPDATSLPVPLITALLKDRKGQIAIDLPIRGNLKDPDFKYGRVLLSTLVNLLGKAVTSPFALVGALVGGSGEELQAVESVPGQPAWLEPDTKKLSALATVLTERPSLSLDIGGGADPQVDGRVLAEVRVMTRLRQLKQEDTKTANGTVPVLSAEDEARLVTRWYDTQFPATPDQAGASPLSVAEMKAKLIDSMRVTDDTLRQLAQQRAERIRDWLVQEGHIDDSRLFLVEPAITESGKTALTLAAH